MQFLGTSILAKRSTINLGQLTQGQIELPAIESEFTEADAASNVKMLENGNTIDTVAEP